MIQQPQSQSDRELAVYPEILALTLDDAFIAALSRLLTRLEPASSWEAFSRIPAGPPEPAGWLRQLRDLAGQQLLATYGYLAPNRTRQRALQLLAARHGADSCCLYHFLCLNHVIDERRLLPLLSREELGAFVEAGVLIRRDSALMLPVTLVPYRDHVYLAEAWHVKENREAYGIAGAHVCHETILQVEHLRRELARRRWRPGRVLEMGCGIGVVALELRELAGPREGAEYEPRNLLFAQANKRLAGDSEVTFYQSDLFAAVQGAFELIIFNPWQPSWEHLELIERFLEQASGHLLPAGEIMLTLNSRPEQGGDRVLDTVSRALARAGLVAERVIACSWREGGQVVMTSYLWIRRPRSGDRRQPGQITQRHDGGWLRHQTASLLRR